LISDSDLSDIDYLIDGQFVTELADYRLPFRGSSNQRIIDVQKSIANNKVVLWGDDNE
jgi:anaerobic ribonucleoside-triphosphate reductase activating protein